MNRYPNEPAPRIVQYGFPALTRRALSIFVNNTVIQPDWYVSSISEYGGARGTTAGKMLTLATTLAGCFQFVLALCIYQYGAYEYLARFILLVIGALGCLCIGLAESALLWKYGRVQQIRLLWDLMDITNQHWQVQNALNVLREMQHAVEEEKEAKQNNDDEIIIVHSHWNYLLSRSNYKLRRLSYNVSLPSAHPSLEPSSMFMVTHKSAWHGSEGYLTVDQIQNGITELTAAITKDRYDQPPEAYIVLTKFETEVADVIVSGKSGTSAETILQADDQEKGIYSTIHMISALLLIFCNFAAHVISLDELRVNPARYGSFILAIVGMSAFIVFCMMQFLSGNYNSSLPIPACLMPYLTTTSPNCCLHRLYCPQTQPNTYGKWSKKSLSLCFILVETIAFVTIVVSTPLEAILLSYV